MRHSPSQWWVSTSGIWQIEIQGHCTGNLESKTYLSFHVVCGSNNGHIPGFGLYAGSSLAAEPISTKQTSSFLCLLRSPERLATWWRGWDICQKGSLSGYRGRHRLAVGKQTWGICWVRRQTASQHALSRVAANTGWTALRRAANNSGQHTPRPRRVRVPTVGHRYNFLGYQPQEDTEKCQWLHRDRRLQCAIKQSYIPRTAGRRQRYGVS